MKRLIRLIGIALVSLTVGNNILAEQYIQMGDTQAHYIVLNTMFLSPEIASQYKITRGNNRAIVNLSFISKQGLPLSADIKGQVKNLLGQLQTLSFAKITEKDAIYYIAPLVYTNRDTLQFQLDINIPDHAEKRLEFSQRMYFDSDR